MAKLDDGSGPKQPNQESSGIDRRTFLQLSTVAAISLPSFETETAQIPTQKSEEHIDSNLITDLEDILKHKGFTDILLGNRDTLAITRSAEALRTIKELYPSDFAASLTLSDNNSAMLEISIGNLYTVTFKRGPESFGKSTLRLPFSASDQIDRFTVAQCYLQNRLENLLPTDANYIGLKKTGHPLALAGELFMLISNDIHDWNFA